MKKSRITLVIIIVGLLSLVAGYFANSWLSQQHASPTEKKSPRIITTPLTRPDFALLDVEDQLRQASEWDGKVLMINFWATWCPPCRREMPAFIKLHHTYHQQGFSILGIAIDEKQSVIDFIDPLGVNYPILLGDQQGIALAKSYGNRLGVLPYTVFINRDGKIVYTHRNELSYEQAEKVIKPLL